MDTASRKGIVIGSLVGLVAAVSNWEGKIIVAASSIVFATLIGWAIGLYIDKDRKGL